MSNQSRFFHHWSLEPSVDFLNHGSFGACPTVVMEAQRNLQYELERQPIRFLAPERELEPKLDFVRQRVAQIIHGQPANVAFVRNATDGVNAVLRSFPFSANDQVVVTNHGYNACNNAVRFAAEQHAASVRTASIPFPIADENEIIEAIEAEFTDRTRLLIVDHVTSFSGLIFPIERIVASAHRRGIRVFVDGAHGPGMIPIDVTRIGADFYTANHHKWLCGPKVSGFLHVRPEWQSQVRPTVISHAANRPRPGRSRFLAEFDWTGTYDATTILAMPTAIEFLEGLVPGGLEGYIRANHDLAMEARKFLADLLEIEPPAPESMIGSMVTLPLPLGPPWPLGEIDPLQKKLFEKYRIEVPILTGPPSLARTASPSRWIRISCQAYNDLEQYRRLGHALRNELAAGR